MARPPRTVRPKVNPQRLLDAVPAAIAYIDRRARFVAVSRAWAEAVPGQGATFRFTLS